MTDPNQAGQLTEEQARAYLEQLRDANPAEVVVQAFRVLGTAAEVKLGRSDARILIDALVGMIDGVDGKVPQDLIQQMREAVSQLQLAQVQSEREASEQPEEAGAQPSEGAAEGGTQGESEQGQAERGQAAGSQGGQRMTDRLWVPGRGPAPGSRGAGGGSAGGGPPRR